MRLLKSTTMALIQDHLRSRLFIFTTDSAGRCHVIVDSRTIHISGSDAFVGGVTLGLYVQ
jgi:hypothetical protein